MQLLLCAATEPEIAATIDFLKKHPGNNVDILTTGIGLMATSYQLAKYIVYKRPSFILQAGIAGSFNKDIPLNTTVAIRSEVAADEGVMENGDFKSVFDLKLNDPDKYPWKQGRLINENPILNDCGIKIVDGISINEISTSKDRIEVYKKKYGASIESMEGAALHYICLMENIPFLQLRTISNYVGERDKRNWTIGTAIAQLNFEVQRILNKINAQ